MSEQKTLSPLNIAVITFALMASVFAFAAGYTLGHGDHEAHETAPADTVEIVVDRFIEVCPECDDMRLEAE